MADGIQLKFDIPAFKAQMVALGQDFERKTMRLATAAATRVFKDRIISFVPVAKDFLRKGLRPGLLRRSIYVKRSKDSTSGREHYFAGVRYGKRAARRKGNQDAFYWRWVEEGHLARGPGSGLQGGTRRRALQRKRLNAVGAGRVRAQPYLSAGFKAGGREALAKFTEIVARRIEKANATR